VTGFGSLVEFEVFGLADVDDGKSTPLGEPWVFVSAGTTLRLTGGLELDPTVRRLSIVPVVAGMTVSGEVLEACLRKSLVLAELEFEDWLALAFEFLGA